MDASDEFAEFFETFNLTEIVFYLAEFVDSKVWDTALRSVGLRAQRPQAEDFEDKIFGGIAFGGIAFG